jgi:hypothetical protein
VALWNRFTQGLDTLMGSPQLPQGGVMGEPQVNPQQDARLALASSLLAGSNSGQGFNQIFGKALMAGQAARQQAQQSIQQNREQQSQEQFRQAQIQQMQAPPDDPAEIRTLRMLQEDPELLAMYQKMNAGKADTPASVQEWQFFQTLPPESQAQYLNMKRQPAAPQLAQIGGVQNIVDRVNGTVKPLSTLETEAAAQGALAEGKAVGQMRGEAQGGIEKKAIGAGNVLDIISIAEPLIDVATGSTAGAATDAVAGFFGKSLKGAQATAQLRALEASLILAQPRMEGPQSNADALRYEQAAGQIGDPKIPRDTKKAALTVIKQLQSKYKQAAGQAPADVTSLLDKYDPQSK